jgi:sugar/nucleoside kinase (ribokinase family)
VPKSTKVALKPLDVLLVSDIRADLVLTGEVRPKVRQVEQIVSDYSLEVGGSASVFASQLAKLGARVGVLGYVGADIVGDLALQELSQIGIDITRIKRHPSVKTGVGIHLAERSDRAILTYLGSIDATCSKDLDDAVLDSCRHWHLTSYFLLTKLRTFWPHWLRKCRKAGVTTSLGTSGDPSKRWDGLMELLPYIDVFLPSEAEALSHTGETDVWGAAGRLASRGPLTVVKCGEKRAIALKGNKRWEVRNPDEDVPRRPVVDTIGAGDNFDAGFIRSWLLNFDISSSLRLGCDCAVRSLRFPGGLRGQLRKSVAGEVTDIVAPTISSGRLWPLSQLF